MPPVLMVRLALGGWRCWIERYLRDSIRKSRSGVGCLTLLASGRWTKSRLILPFVFLSSLEAWWCVPGWSGLGCEKGGEQSYS